MCGGKREARRDGAEKGSEESERTVVAEVPGKCRETKGRGRDQLQGDILK